MGTLDKILGIGGLVAITTFGTPDFSHAQERETKPPIVKEEGGEKKEKKKSYFFF